MIAASNIKLATEEHLTWLKAFAIYHKLESLEDLLALPLSTIQQMHGFNTHVQNEIIELVQRCGLLKELKQY